MISPAIAIGSPKERVHVDRGQGNVRQMPLSAAQREQIESALEEVKTVVGQIRSEGRWCGNLSDGELMSEGYWSLIHATRTWDRAYEKPFAVYARYRVRYSIMKAVARESKLSHRVVFGAYLDAWEYLAGQGGQVEGDWRSSQEDYERHLHAFSDWLLASMFAGLVARLQREGGEDGVLARKTYEQALVALDEAKKEMNDREQLLLRLRYEESADWDRIADELGISKSTAQRYHTTVLGRLSAILRRLGIAEATEEEP